MSRPVNDGQNIKAAARSSTVTSAYAPTITGSLSNLNEDYMDNEMLFASWDQNLVNEGLGSFQYFEEHLSTLIDIFKSKFPSASDVLKTAGNRAFEKKNYEEAVKQYNLAIEMSQEKPNYIYFVKRANAYL